MCMHKIVNVSFNRDPFVEVKLISSAIEPGHFMFYHSEPPFINRF